MRRELTRTAASTAAWTIGALGALYAVLSAYWLVGGGWLLNTFGTSLDRWMRPRELFVLAGLWLIVFAKAGVAAAAPLAVNRWQARTTAAPKPTASGQLR
ncbi:hypothetical protein ACIA49_34880 [Kribbella sp. NPDC051587]|uniref:hypothetical protein n=1 Tax=Kribbella sp. NPDC051587 TaxID=3364119 RepID=UPI0037B088C7